jgi:Raf kinase inhibitor-like YbhB/YbcL family protein
LALGGGYECIIIIHNKTATQWNGTGTLRQGNDGNWASSWALDGTNQAGTSAFNIALAPNETNKYVLSGDATPRAGYLEIAGLQGADVESVVITFFYNLSGQAGNLMDSIGTPVLPPGTDFAFTVENQQLVRTGFAYAPFCVRGAFKVTLTLIDANGIQVGQPKEYLFNGQKAEFIDGETFPNVPKGFVGTVYVRSEELIFLTVLRMETLPQGGIQLTSAPPQMLLDIGTTAFSQGEVIPTVHSAQGCGGTNELPPLYWNKAPDGTQSWVLIVDDLDAPGGTWIHWILFNVSPETRMLPLGSVPAGARQGLTSAGGISYNGPCPPPGTVHRYFFKLYALDATLNLSDGARIDDVMQAINGHVLGTAQVMGLFPAPAN